MFRTSVLFFSLATTLAISNLSHACNVPVFRYALERWRPDVYELFVFHREPLTPEQLAVVKKLEAAPENPDRQSNINVATVDLTKEPAKWLTKLWDEQQATQSPWVVIQAPNFRAQASTIWSGPLVAETINGWLESPARQELTRRLMKGDSIVWLYLNDGKVDEKNEIFVELSESLAALKNDIQLPEGVGEVGSELYTNVPFNLHFSVLPVDRNDPAEQTFVTQLLRGNEKIAEEKGPLVFPIFGCGRVLDALSGEDLSNETYGLVATYLCGACSCQVKDQNPGWDLLLTANWQGMFDRGEEGQLPEFARAGRQADETAEPVLVPIPKSNRSPAAIEANSKPATTNESNSSLLAGLLLAGTLFLVSIGMTIRGYLA